MTGRVIDRIGEMNNMENDCISRQAAIAVADSSDYVGLSVEDVKKVTDEVVKGLKRLPSAQPEQRKGTMLLNLNDNIKVKLTDLGKDIYYHQYDRTNKFVGKEICKPSFPKEDENGYTEFQLWCFMELYGPNMGMTLPNVIQPLDLIIEPERIIEHFEQMPSAQPEKMQLSTEKTQLSKEDSTKDATFDCISREDAIDAVKHHMNNVSGGNDEYYIAHRHIIELLQIVPTAEPESRREWYMKGYRDAQRWIPCEYATAMRCSTEPYKEGQDD